jgi:hypothetical protein
LKKTNEFTESDGMHMYEIDDDLGGGATWGSKGQDQEVIISGHSVTTIPYSGGRKLTNTRGQVLRNDPADILVHELVGHAIPAIAGSDTGNAVKNENKARSQEFAAGQRMPEAGHTEELSSGK